MCRIGSTVNYKVMFAISLLLEVFFFSGCSNTIGIPEKCEIPINRTTFSFDKGLYPSSLDLFKEYRIQPGDQLDVLFQVTTWKLEKKFKISIDHTISVKFVTAPSLNETQRVLPDGTVVLPYLGPVKVVGKTIPELTRYLTSRYRSILRDPIIYVTVPEFRAAIKELKKDLHTAPRGLSRLVTVAPDGYATFPLLGEIFVAGKTVAEVDSMLDKKYDEYLKGLHVDLFLQKTAGASIYVFGEVGKSGVVPIEKPISVIQAITMAGGYTPNADLRYVVVFRRHENRVIGRRINLKRLLTGNNPEGFFYLRPDDIVFVPKTRVASIADLMSQVQRVIFWRGWSGVNFGYSIK